MKRLSENLIKMGRDLEKSSSTFEPKRVWLRAWQIMLERHF